MDAPNRLFLELLFVSGILMSVLLINNIFLYKQKIKDYISMMLILGIVSCIFEILWVVVDGHPKLRVFAYIFVSSYCIVCLIFEAFLDRYLLERIGILPGKKLEIIIYALPIAAFALACVTTPWTKLVFWVDEGGVVRTEELFNSLFQGMVLLYIFIPVLIAIFFLTLGKKFRPADGEIPVSLIVFGIMAPVIFAMELIILGEGMDDFQTTSIPISLALVYLVTNMSTHSVLDAQAQIKSVETELRIASKIQTDALPPVAPEFANHLDLNLRGSMTTAKEVGGDFYDYFPIDDNRLCFLIADVSGKGTPAALFMMTCKTMIKDYALMKNSTSEIFTSVNERLCENNDEGMFATAWIGIVDTRTMTLQYTNAGHNYPCLLRKDQPCEIIKENHGLFLGGLEFTQYKQGEIQLESGDRVLLYTDGVVEAHDRSGGLYGNDRLDKMLDSTRDCTGEQVLQRILNDVNDFAVGVPQFDDITMIILSIK